MNEKNLIADKLTDADLREVSGGEDGPRYAFNIGDRARYRCGPGPMNFEQVVICDRKAEKDSVLFFMNTYNKSYLITRANGTQIWCSEFALVHA
jgi:hypothetical protein